jgi:hypothetical protein
MAINSCLFAQILWSNLIKRGDTIIDATLGNGHDTLALARLLKGTGQLVGYDIQKISIQNTQTLLNKHLTYKEQRGITLLHSSHECFTILEAKLIVYNLGYLPGGDKTITTRAETTLKSLENGLAILQLGGALSVMCYVGHDEGKKECAQILDFFQSLPSHTYSVCQYLWINKHLAPQLFWCQKLSNKKDL